MAGTERRPVTVEVLGHLIFYLSSEYRDGSRARMAFRPGIAVGYLPEMLGIPPEEIQAVVVNGTVVTDKSAMLGPGDQVVIMPAVSAG